MVRHRLLPAPSAPPASPAGASRSLATPRSKPTLDNDGLSGWNNASDNSQHLRNVPINILLRLQPCPSVPSLPAQCVEGRSDIITDMASLHHSSVRLSDLDPLTEWDLTHLLKLGDTLESIPAYRYSASESFPHPSTRHPFPLFQPYLLGIISALRSRWTLHTTMIIMMGFLR